MVATLITVMFGVAVAGGPAGHHGGTRWPPEASQYSVAESFRGVPAPVDLTSHPEARRFRTVLREAAKKGPNFAGRYTVAMWGCGTNCQQFAIIDAATGRVLAWSHAVNGLQYDLSSQLLVVNPPDPDGSLPLQELGLTTEYYLWDDHKLKELKRE